MQKYSFNVHGQFLRDKAKLYAWIIKNKPTSIVVLDEEKIASEIADLGVPHVVLRVTPNDDNIHIKIRSFAEWWNIVKHKYKDKRLGVYFANEPDVHWDRFALMAIEGMEILNAEGHWGVFGNIAVGKPEKEVWKGELRPFLMKLVEYKDRHMLGLHEGYMYSPEYAIPYLSGRYREVFEVVGRDNIRILLTEFGVDDIEDVRKRVYGIPIRGWKQHAEFWKSQGVENPQQLMLDHFAFLLERFYYDPEIVGICNYSYGDSGGWSLYDFQDAEYFLDNMGQLEMNVQIPVVTKTLIRSTSKGGTNRRTGAGTSFPASKTMLMRTPVEVEFLESKEQWDKYRFSDGDFWLHRSYVEVVTPGKDVTINLYDATEEEIAEVKALINSMERLSTLFKKLKAEIVVD